jgi:hypothetical protein
LEISPSHVIILREISSGGIFACAKLHRRAK